MKNGLSFMESMTMVALVSKQTAVVGSYDDLQDYVDMLIRMEKPVPPVIVTLSDSTGRGHAHIFLPKHSKKLHLPTSTTIWDLIEEDLTQHEYRQYIPCDRRCPICHNQP